MTIDTKHLTALGSKVEGALTWEQLETFDAPSRVEKVVFETQEVTALCPVTNQPDLYHVTIEYRPDGACVESKTLKLYLMRFRNLGMFGESIADTICSDLSLALKPSWIEVTATQQIRGGLQMTVTAMDYNV
jgi:7-cyano-7-deazaguanine reductase